MPGSYSFANTFGSSNFVSQTQFSIGAGVGIDAPAEYWARGAAFHFNNNDVSIVPVALRAGQTIALDLDFGIGGIDNIDARYTVINSSGIAVAGASSSAGLDNGTTNAADPRGTFTAAVTGIYFIAVSQQNNAYVNGTFEFNDAGTDGGDFVLDLGFASLSPNILGTGSDDNVALGLTELRYSALGGDDYIQASINGTTIDGGEGSDTLQGSNGSDILFGGDDNDNLYGYGGVDVLIGGRGSDYQTGGLGNDELLGGDDGDNLYGEDGNDTLAGEAGSDSLYGGNHHDKIYGGGDTDYITGGLGNDLIDGGDGRDTANYTDAIGNLNVNLALAGAQVTGMGTDTLSSIEDLNGGSFADTLRGNADPNTLVGNGGNDKLYGNAGNDTLYGYDATDYIFGDAGSDFIFAGAGIDHLYGGSEADTFYYSAASESTVAASDRIYDFSNASSDRINLSNVYSGTLVFVGAGPFTGTAAEVRVVAGAFQSVYVDTDGNGTADMRIFVQSITPLVGGDFQL